MSTAYTFDAPETTSGGNYIEHDCTCHFIISEVDENPTNKKGEAINGFRVSMQVLASTDPTQADKDFSEVFTSPHSGDKPSAAQFKQKKVASLFIAANLMAPSQLGQRGLAFDLQKMAHQQIIATIKVTPGKDNPDMKFANIDGTKIYHIDDPRAASYPKDTQTMALPGVVRQVAGFFANLVGGKTTVAPSGTTVQTTGVKTNGDDIPF